MNKAAFLTSNPSPSLNRQPPMLVQLHQILLGLLWNTQVITRIKKILIWLELLQILWSFLESRTFTVLGRLLVLLQRRTVGSQTVQVLVMVQDSGIQAEALSQDPHLPAHNNMVEAPERGWETKVAFTQSQRRGDGYGMICSPDAGCCPVTLSSKMCEISFCWAFYIKRNLFSEKHSISQTLMVFLCADALMRLWVILIRRKPCR